MSEKRDDQKERARVLPSIEPIAFAFLFYKITIVCDDDFVITITDTDAPLECTVRIASTILDLPTFKRPLMKM